jgi:hypothetical protein
MIVNWKSKILNLVQDSKKDRTYQAFQNIHDGLNTLQTSVQDIKINSTIPFGKTDGTNNIFSIPNEPAFISVNGVMKINGVDFTYKNGFATFVTAPPSGATIRGFHV